MVLVAIETQYRKLRFGQYTMLLETDFFEYCRPPNLDV